MPDTACFEATKPNNKSNADNHIRHTCLPTTILTKPDTIPKTTSIGF